MFFYLSKILGFFAQPSNLVIGFGLLGLLLLATRRARLGARMGMSSLVALAILGFSPLGNALIIPLEGRFPPWRDDGRPPHGVIILGGAISPDISHARGQAALNEAAERIVAGVELARRYPAMRVVYSGGSGALIYRAGNEARIALRLFERLGLPGERINAEDRSRDTAENARFSRDLVAPKQGERWLLVTSAYHMPRAIGAFRQAGFALEAYPVDWRTGGRADFWRPFHTLGDGLRRTDTAAREWAGLAVYWLTGRSPELFPGPRPGGSGRP